MQQTHGDNKGTSKWVMLIAPGANLPTIGALLFLGVHFFVDSLIWSSGIDKTYFFYQSYGLSWEGLREGHWVSFISHAFLHGNWIHVIINALLFFYSAARLSHILPPLKVLLLFLSCAYLSSLPQVIVQAFWPQIGNGPLVGASGGVMGLFLAVTVLYPDSKMMLIKVSARNVGKGFLIASALLFLMTPKLGVPLFWIVGEWSAGLFGRELFSLAHLPHFFGGLAGMLLVDRMLPALVTLEDLQVERSKKEADLLSSSADLRS